MISLGAGLLQALGQMGGTFFGRSIRRNDSSSQSLSGDTRGDDPTSTPSATGTTPMSAHLGYNGLKGVKMRGSKNVARM